MPGYDVDGKLWTIQYHQRGRNKAVCEDSRKQGCFHVFGAPNGATAIQKTAMSSMVVIAEGYATAVTLAKHGKGPTLAAYDSGNLLSVANAVHQRYPNKARPKTVPAGKKRWLRPRQYLTWFTNSTIRLRGIFYQTKRNDDVGDLADFSSSFFLRFLLLFL